MTPESPSSSQTSSLQEELQRIEAEIQAIKGAPNSPPQKIHELQARLESIRAQRKQEITNEIQEKLDMLKQKLEAIQAQTSNTPPPSTPEQQEIPSFQDQIVTQAETYISQKIPQLSPFMKLLSKIETWWNQFQNALSHAEMLISQGQFTKAFSVFLAGLFGTFSMQNPHQETPQNGENRAPETTLPEEQKETNNAIHLALGAIERYINVTNETKHEYIAIWQKNTFLDLTLEEIDAIANSKQKLKEWIKKTYENEENITEEDKELIEKAFFQFSSEGTGRQFLSIIQKDIPHTIPLRNVIENIAKGSHFSFLQDFINNPNIAEIASYAVNPGNTSEIISDTAHKTNLSKNVIMLFLQNNIHTYMEDTDMNAILIKNDLIKNEEEKQQAKQLLEFGRNIHEMIKNEELLHLNDEDVRKILGKQLTGEEIIVLYSITQGKTSFDELSTLQQLLIYGIIFSIIHKNDAYQSGQMLAKYVEKLEKAISGKLDIQLPAELQSFFDFSKKYLEKKVNDLFNAISTTFGFSVEFVKNNLYIIPIIALIIQFVLRYVPVIAVRKTIFETVAGAASQKK